MLCPWSEMQRYLALIVDKNNIVHLVLYIVSKSVLMGLRNVCKSLKGSGIKSLV